MLGKAIWRLRIQENPSAAGDSAEGAYSAPANPLVGGEGWLSPPRESHPTALGPSGLASPKLVPMPSVADLEGGQGAMPTPPPQTHNGVCI